MAGTQSAESESGSTSTTVADVSTTMDPPTDDSTADTGTTAAAESSSTGTPLVLPTPCDEVANVFVSEPASEPNDAPEEATDLCTIDVVGSWHVAAEIGGDDVIDHFVFHSAGDSGVVPLLLDACFAAELLLELFQFSDGELVLLWSGLSSAPTCEDIPPAIPAGEDYLLVVSVPEGAELPAGTAYGW
jgi:hypothetical protein